MAQLADSVRSGQQALADAQLVEAARAGSQQAFAALVARYENLVCAVAYAHTGSVQQSQEIAQEVFIATWKNLPGLRGPFNPWIRGIAHKMSLRSIRDAGRRARRWTLESRPDASSAAPSPLQQMITQEEERLLWRALGAIPEAYRIPLVLYYREDRSVEAVGRLLDLSIQNVRQRLVRGRRMLREHVELTVGLALAKTRAAGRVAAAVMAAITLAGGGSSARADGARGAPIHAGHRSRASRLAGAGAAALLGTIVIFGSTSRLDARRAEPPSSPAATPGGRAPGLANAFALASLPAAGAAPVAAEQGAVLAPSGRILLQADFQDGTSPFPLDLRTTVVGCPERAAEERCLVGVLDLPGTEWLATGFGGKTTEPLFRYTKSQILEMDYWYEGSGPLTIQISDWDKGQHHIRLRDPARRAWTHVEVSLADAIRESPPGVGTHMIEGDAIIGVYFNTPYREGNAFYLDNVVILEP